MTDNLDAAVAWWQAEPRLPLVEVRCHRGCRLGTVFATPHGRLLAGWRRVGVHTTLDDAPPTRQSLRVAVLLDADGAQFPADCRHDDPKVGGFGSPFVDLDLVRRTATDVQAGRTRRPAHLMV